MALPESTKTKLTDWYTDYMSKQQSGASSPFNSAGYTPTTLSDSNTQTRTVVSGSNETVAGQMDSLLKSGSPYMERARAGAMETANSRGLLNSSIAASAGEKAAIESALPIAQADAGTFKAAADYNTALANERAKYNADQGNAYNMARLEVDSGMVGKQMDIDAQRAAAVTEQQGKLDLQAAQAQADASKTNSSLINNILMTTDLSPDRKAALLRELNAPGLANAIHVVNSTSQDLAPSGSPAGVQTGGAPPEQPIYEAGYFGGD